MRHSSRLVISCYSTGPRTRKYVKGYGFLLFVTKYKKQLLDTGLDSLKTASKKVVQKASEFLGTKIANAVTKSNKDKIVKQEPAEEIIIPPEKRWNITRFKTSIIIKMELYKRPKVLNNSAVSKVVTKNGSK